MVRSLMGVLSAFAKTERLPTLANCFNLKYWEAICSKPEYLKADFFQPTYPKRPKKACLRSGCPRKFPASGNETEVETFHCTKRMGENSDETVLKRRKIMQKEPLNDGMRPQTNMIQVVLKTSTVFIENELGERVKVAIPEAFGNKLLIVGNAFAMGNTFPKLFETKSKVPSKNRIRESFRDVRDRVLEKSRACRQRVNGLFVNAFLAKYINFMTVKQLKTVEKLLENPGKPYDIYSWAIGEETIPKEFREDVREMVKTHYRALLEEGKGSRKGFVVDT